MLQLIPLNLKVYFSARQANFMPHRGIFKTLFPLISAFSRKSVYARIDLKLLQLQGFHGRIVRNYRFTVCRFPDYLQCGLWRTD